MTAEAASAAVVAMGLVNAARFRHEPGGDDAWVDSLASALTDHDPVAVLCATVAQVTAAAAVAEAGISTLLADPALLDAAARAARTIGPLSPAALHLDAASVIENLSRGCVTAEANHR